METFDIKNALDAFYVRVELNRRSADLARTLLPHDGSVDTAALRQFLTVERCIAEFREESDALSALDDEPNNQILERLNQRAQECSELISQLGGN